MNMKKVICAGVSVFVGLLQSWGAQQQGDKDALSGGEQVGQVALLKSQAVQTDCPEGLHFAFLYDLRLTKMEKQISDLYRRMNIGFQSLEKKTGNLFLEVDVVKLNLSELTNDFLDFQKKAETGKLELMRQIEQLSRKNKELQENEAMLKNAQEHIETQKNMFGSISGRLSKTESAFAEFERKMAVLSGQAKGNDEKWNTLYSNVKEQDSEISKQRAGLQALEESIEKLIQGVCNAGSIITKSLTDQKPANS